MNMEWYMQCITSQTNHFQVARQTYLQNEFTRFNGNDNMVEMKLNDINAQF